MSLYLYSYHGIKDYETWKSVWDAIQETFVSFGIKPLHVMHEADDPLRLHLFYEIESIEKFNDFINGDDIADIMQKAGVTEIPTYYFLNEVPWK